MTTAESTTAIDDATFARYQQAWSDGDVDTIVALMTPDALYEASFGPEPYGQRFQGHDAIRAGVSAMFTASPHRSTHEYGERYTFGDHGFSTWSSTSFDADRNPVATVHGCDFYEFKDGLVAKKIAFRKARP